MKNLNKKWGIPVFAWQREAESLDICSLFPRRLHQTLQTIIMAFVLSLMHKLIERSQR